MSNKRRAFSNELKFTIVLEALKGQRQIAEIANEYQVHANQISNWKRELFEKGASVFSKKEDKKKAGATGDSGRTVQKSWSTTV